MTDERADRLLRFDARSLRPRGSVAVGDRPAALSAAPDALWVANLGDRTLTRIDPGTARVVGAPVSLGKEILAIARSPHTLWVAAATPPSPLAPDTGRPLASSISVGAAPLVLAADGEDVWVGSGGNQTVQRLARSHLP